MHRLNPVEVRGVSVQRRLDSGTCSGEGRCEYEFHLKLLLRVSLSLAVLDAISTHLHPSKSLLLPRALANRRVANH